MFCDKTKNYKFLLRSLHEKSLVPMGGKPVILWPSGGRGDGRGEGADGEVWNRLYMIDSRAVASLYPASRGLFLALLLYVRSRL